MRSTEDFAVKEMLRMRAKWINWRLWAVVVVTLTACGPAHAFYWYGWPGSGINPTPSLITPQSMALPGDPQPSGSPSSTPPSQTPSGPPTDATPPPVGPPDSTPEPSTGLIGLVGLGALAAVRRWRKR